MENKNFKYGFVYMIQSILFPDRIYIGSTVNYTTRFRAHKRMLVNGIHDNPILQSHYGKYGMEDLAFEVIEEFNFISKEHLYSREQTWYSRFAFNGAELPRFNISKVAGSPMLGRNHKQAAKDAISKFQKNRPKSKETRDRISKGKKGKPLSPEHVKNLIGSHPDMSGENNPFYGKTHTQKVKDFIKANNTGRKLTEENLRNMSKSQKKRWDEMPEEKRQKIIDMLAKNRFDPTGTKRKSRDKNTEDIK